MRFLNPEHYGTKRFESKWNEELTAYRRHLDAILADLPDSVQDFVMFARRHPLHDRIVEQIESPCRGEVWIHLTGLRLEFLDVRSSKHPNALDQPTYWLFEEVDLGAKGGLVLRGLTDSGEVHIEAGDMRVFGIAERRYLLPADPPHANSTLARDRQGSGRQKK